MLTQIQIRLLTKFAQCLVAVGIEHKNLLIIDFNYRALYQQQIDGDRVYRRITGPV